MDEKELIEEKLILKIKEFSKGSKKDVKRGAETPKLAAMLLQKYGRGIIDAVVAIYDTPRAADAIYGILDDETAVIDPQWREHEAERWAGRPADVIIRADLRDYDGELVIELVKNRALLDSIMKSMLRYCSENNIACAHQSEMRTLIKKYEDEIEKKLFEITGKKYSQLLEEKLVK